MRENNAASEFCNDHSGHSIGSGQSTDLYEHKDDSVSKAMVPGAIVAGLLLFVCVLALFAVGWLFPSAYQAVSIIATLVGTLFLAVAYRASYNYEYLCHIDEVVTSVKAGKKPVRYAGYREYFLEQKAGQEFLDICANRTFAMFLVSCIVWPVSFFVLAHLMRFILVTLGCDVSLQTFFFSVEPKLITSATLHGIISGLVWAFSGLILDHYMEVRIKQEELKSLSMMKKETPGVVPTSW